jgi:hypothetical protein
MLDVVNNGRGPNMGCESCVCVCGGGVGGGRGRVGRRWVISSFFSSKWHEKEIKMQLIHYYIKHYNLFKYKEGAS